ncbi:hypothetical protein J4E80_006334 [Alternaria sp. BMP 0032]|nr:hypothetical protein J4E80_006334 [Alternaria sp. BMP 0032]
MSSSIVEQEAFKASILSHVRAIHGPIYSRGTVFDVVTGWDNVCCSRFICYVIVYPETKPFKAGEVVSADWSPIMASDRADTVNQAYQDILNKLRIEMQKVMGLVETYKKKAEE